MTADALKPFGSSVFAQMTQLANEHDAINLAQGFPDFDGPQEIIDAAIKALRSGVNQYSRSLGYPPLVRAISDFHQRWYDREYDAEREVAVYNGATEGSACALRYSPPEQASGSSPTGSATLRSPRTPRLRQPPDSCA